MKAAIARLVILLIVFCIAFGAVMLWRKWKDENGVPGFLRSQENAMLETGKGQFRPESYTLRELPALDIDDVKLLAHLNSEYTKLVGSVVPSVVSIDTIGERRERLNYLGRTYERTWETTGIGSGVIVTPEGHVITNEHVIEGSLGMKITLHDGRSFPARLIGKDPTLDVAVLRIEGDGPFEALSFGDSDPVQPGEMVFAVGNPFGLGETVTQGIISAKERSISDRQRDLFQTDSAINPGNSGGPLVNYLGEIIGINVAIYSPDKENQGFAGVGFSIPSNDVRESFRQILERGRPIRGFLGLNGRDLSSRVRYELGYPRGTGVAIDAVVPGSPAEAAGLRANDVIQSYNDQPLRSLTQFITMIQRTKVGEEVELKVWRRREELTVQTKIVDYDDWRRATAAKEATRPLANDQEVLRRVGLRVRDLSVLERMRGEQGILVAEVLEGSEAAKAGVEPGDLIIAVNGRRVIEAGDLLARIAASAAVQETQLVLKRGSEDLDVTMPQVIER
ncbi:trypsin-like peptidase domain-containing protein [Roseibacillus persicicus]|uniref:MucD n=1 Tax=Roseibacillus persicicus TaxID=454148 RepID=A0A918TRR2_9BACT|nr:trypsin-like peptidase domain-containing protein [Roseibacillus persicicus]MDQ8190763.1 trypsin-like peptidase domain-containing protein [Roseibacillus persicicus]GHC53847.1 MucD [Roseibacillus persicicus]